MHFSQSKNARLLNYNILFYLDFTGYVLVLNVSEIPMEVYLVGALGHWWLSF